MLIDKFKSYVSDLDIRDRLASLESFQKDAEAKFREMYDRFERQASAILQAAEGAQTAFDRSRTAMDAASAALTDAGIGKADAAEAFSKATQSLNLVQQAYTLATSAYESATTALTNARTAYDRAIAEGRESWNLAVDEIGKTITNVNTLKTQFTTLISQLTSNIASIGTRTAILMDYSEDLLTINIFTNPFQFADKVRACFSTTRDIVADVSGTFGKLNLGFTAIKNGLTALTVPARK